MKFQKNWIWLVFLALLWHGSQAQQKTKAIKRCGTVEYMQQLRERYPSFPSDEAFEEWLAPRLKSLEEAKRKGIYKKATYTIPVVVHVIHNGENVGAGTNLPYAQIESQIRVLNEDFNRTNADAVNTPGDFQPVAGSISIEFKLATRDPDGLPLAEPGVHRVDRNTMGWDAPPFSDSYVESVIKPATIWDPNQYLNIWVLDLSGGLLGYAQFPESTLDGLPNTGEESANTDGVVIWHKAFGSNYDASGAPVNSPYDLLSAYDRGRTTTHEVGHFLGLRHIWGDGDCNADDFVSDTPTADGDNSTAAPCTYPGRNSCNDGANDLPDMFQNYMDYSNDVCMNLFTQGQMSRVETVLQNSPRRKELLSSSAADPLPIYASFKVDVEAGCAPLTVTFTDQSGVDTGEQPISSWTWNFDVTAVGGSVSPANSASGAGPHTITFDPTTLGAGSYTYEIELVVSNGSKSASFKKSVTVVVPDASQPLPLNEGFESGTITDGNGTTGTWQVSTNSPDGGWDFTSAAYEGSQALWVNNYDVDLRGKRVEVLSPYFDLAGVAKPQLRFFVAYAPYSSNFYDGLEVVLLTDCGATETILYTKEGQALATAPSTTLLFTPTPEQWREEIIDLSAYIGQSDLRIAIRNKGGWGNALYIDGVKLYDELVNADISLSATRGKSPFTVTISDASRVESGQPAINSWSWDFNASGAQNFTIMPYATASTSGPHTITYEVQSSTAGLYNVQVKLTVSNGSFSDTKQVPLIVEVPLNAPQNMVASSDGVSAVVISWTYPDDNGAEGFRIERSENGQTFTMVGATALNELSYTDETVLLGKTYYYRVYAYNDTKQVQSDYTPVQQVTVSEFVTGIESPLSQSVRVFPNPNQGAFTVALPEVQNANLRVMNQLGQVVWRGSVEGKKKELQLDLPQGVYFLQVQLKDRLETLRLVIE